VKRLMSIGVGVIDMVKSIFDATMCECPVELESQANEMVELTVSIDSYMRKHRLNLNDVIYDLKCIME